MSKQTAVIWLEKEIERLTTRAGIHMSWEVMDGLLNEAKAMEKEQIEIAFKDGATIFDGYDNAEHYYNQTYKEDKQ